MIDWLLAHQTEVLVNLVSSLFWVIIVFMLVRSKFVLTKTKKSDENHHFAAKLVEVMVMLEHEKSAKFGFFWLRDICVLTLCALGLVVTGCVTAGFFYDIYPLFFFSLPALLFVGAALVLVWPRAKTPIRPEEVGEVIMEVMKQLEPVKDEAHKIPDEERKTG